MRRDRRLQGLSSDHHHALVLARQIRRASGRGTADGCLVEVVWDRYQTSLRPHFEVEEQVLLPALADSGASGLAERTRAEHQDLRALLDKARAGRRDALQRFASHLELHVRFEERLLFPACEQLLHDAVLDEVALRAPKRPQPRRTTGGAP